MFLQKTSIGKQHPELAKIAEKIYGPLLLRKEYTIEEIQMAFIRRIRQLPPDADTVEKQAHWLFGSKYKNR